MERRPISKRGQEWGFGQKVKSKPRGEALMGTVGERNLPVNIPGEGTRYSLAKE